MRKQILTKLLILVLLLISLLPVTFSGYSYWDNLSQSQIEELNIGAWHNYVVAYDFSQDTIATLTSDGALSNHMNRWAIVNDVLTNNNDNNTDLFIPFDATEYTINSTASLPINEAGGYDIFFDITISNDDPSTATGYLLRINQTKQDGTLLIKPVLNNKLQTQVWKVKSANSDAFPGYSEDPTWWTSSHDISISVSLLNSTTKTVTIYIDSALVGSYDYSFTPSTTIYTGYRVWKTIVEINTINVDTE